MYQIGDLCRKPRFFLAILFASWAFLITFPTPLHSVDLRAGRRVSIPFGETVNGDLYTAAGELLISGSVNGDLIAAGGDVILNGAVSYDTEVLGGQVQVNGKIGGDLRIAAGEIDLNGSVVGDLVVAGGQVRVHSGASVGGDVLLAGGEVLLEGDLGKSLKAAGGDVTMNGRIGGPVRLRAGKVVIGERANLESELTYFAPDEAEIREGARIAGPIHFFVVSGMDQNWFQRGVHGLDFAFYSLGFMMTLVAGLLVCIFLRKLSQGLIAYALPNFGKELLRGFVLFLVIPAAIFLMFVTVVGAPFAFVTGMMHLAFGMIAIVFTGIAEGALLRKRIQKKEQYEVTWKAALLGIPLAFLISLVPYAGFVVNAIFFLVIFGSLYERFWILIRSSA